MYGETEARQQVNRGKAGLSPRVRGNRGPPLSQCGPCRSIPACTGKPFMGSVVGSVVGVYPRVYGETSGYGPVLLSRHGLSPRVRGNPYPSRASTWASGSIPACTGKPNSSAECSIPRRVYPRVYGETCSTRRVNASSRGLSPRVRGNRHRNERRIRSSGSIPACTGKPLTDTPRILLNKVYPRVYGETAFR